MCIDNNQIFEIWILSIIWILSYVQAKDEVEQDTVKKKYMYKLSIYDSGEYLKNNLLLLLCKST